MANPTNKKHAEKNDDDWEKVENIYVDPDHPLARKLRLDFSHIMPILEQEGFDSSTTKMLGSGVSGLVYSVKPRSGDIVLAVKIGLLPESKREGDILRQLAKYRHPNIVGFLDARAVSNPTPRTWDSVFRLGIIVMECCAAGSMRDGVIDNIPPVWFLWRAGVHIFRALKFLHDGPDDVKSWAGIQHNDIHMSNVFITHPVSHPDVVVKLGDFGHSIQMTEYDCEGDADVGDTLRMLVELSCHLFKSEPIKVVITELFHEFCLVPPPERKRKTTTEYLNFLEQHPLNPESKVSAPNTPCTSRTPIITPGGAPLQSKLTNTSRTPISSISSVGALPDGTGATSSTEYSLELIDYEGDLEPHMLDRLRIISQLNAVKRQLRQFRGIYGAEIDSPIRRRLEAQQAELNQRLCEMAERMNGYAQNLMGYFKKKEEEGMDEWVVMKEMAMDES